MTENRIPNHPSRGKTTEPWRIERMVQRVPGHIGEESRFSPWLVVGAVVVIIIVGALLLFFSGFPGTGLASSGSQFTRTPHATTTTTTIIITATPEATMVPTAA